MVLLSLTASHREMDLDALERLSSGSASVGRFAVGSCRPVRGAVVISTCNRFELYLDVDAPISGSAVQHATEHVAEVVAAASGISTRSAVGAFTVRTGADVVAHLFEVASGLDSMVIGEREIAGQVKRALEVAREQRTTSKTLELLFQTASRTSKVVGTSTELGAAGRSIVRLALDLAADALPPWRQVRTVLIGTGSYAGATVAALRGRGVRDVRVYSQSGRAQQFAQGHDVVAVGSGEDALVAALADADLVVSVSGARGRGIATGVLTADAVTRAQAARAQEAGTPAARAQPATTPGAGAPGAGARSATTPGAGVPGGGARSATTPGAGVPGGGARSATTPGADAPGGGAASATTPGADAAGAGARSATTPGADAPGAGARLSTTPGADVLGGGAPSATTPGADAAGGGARWVTTPGAPGADVPGSRDPDARTGPGPLVILDLALHRDVDPAVRALGGVVLHDLQDLKAHVPATARAVVDHARTIVDDAVRAFLDHQVGREADAAVVALLDEAEQQVRTEVDAEVVRLRAELAARGEVDALGRPAEPDEDEVDRVARDVRRRVHTALHRRIAAARAAAVARARAAEHDIVADAETVTADAASHIQA